MTKALMSMALMGLLAGTAYVASAQQEERPSSQRPAQQEGPSADDVFARLDADRDGKLSESEFSRAFASQATDDEKKQEFSEWDANGDESISKQEFAAKYSPGR